MENKRNYCVYEHIFPNGMIYIGLTKQNVKDRWENGYGYKSQPVYEHILEYGWENVKHFIVEDSLTASEAQVLEKELIKKYKDKGIAYNEDDGGGLGSCCYAQIEYNGKLYSSQELAEMSQVEGLTYTDITTRVNHHGWSVDRALSQPKKKKNFLYEYNGKQYLIKELLEISTVDGISENILNTRINKHGWDIERAITQPINVKLQPKGVGDRIYEYKGKMYNSYELTQISDVDGLTSFDITNRINHHGWSVEDAITKPKKKMNQKFEYNGRLYSSKELAEIATQNGLENIEYHDITDRIRLGWTVEEAVTKPKIKNSTKKK